MESFGVVGATLGIMGFLLAALCLTRQEKLIKTLKEKGILDKEYKEE